MQFYNDNEYKISFVKSKIDDEYYLIPKYAINRPACKTVLKGRYFELDTLEIIKSIYERFPGNIIHAGTFFGDMIPYLSKLVHDNYAIYAFEPLLENYVLAKCSLEINCITNVLLFNSALGNSIKNCFMTNTTSNNVHAGGESHLNDKGNSISTMLTIDNLNIDRLSILHLDIEGSELQALEGSINTIKRHHPAILIEDGKRNCANFLNKLGYNLIKTTKDILLYEQKEKL